MRTIKQIKARKRNFTIMYLTIEYLLILIKETNYEDSFYGETQKDVKYECKESNQ